MKDFTITLISIVVGSIIVSGSHASLSADYETKSMALCIRNTSRALPSELLRTVWDYQRLSYDQKVKMGLLIMFKKTNYFIDIQLNTSIHCCKWHGVRCPPRYNGTVTIEIPSQLTGTIDTFTHKILFPPSAIIYHGGSDLYFNGFPKNLLMLTLNNLQTDLKLSALSQLHDLRVLSLSNNGLTTLDCDSLPNNLVSLHLAGNNLNNLSSIAVPQLPASLRMINLDNNPIHSDVLHQLLLLQQFKQISMANCFRTNSIIINWTAEMFKGNTILMLKTELTLRLTSNHFAFWQLNLKQLVFSLEEAYRVNQRTINVVVDISNDRDDPYWARFIGYSGATADHMSHIVVISDSGRITIVAKKYVLRTTLYLDSNLTPMKL
eukprot:968382_1